MGRTMGAAESEFQLLNKAVAGDGDALEALLLEHFEPLAAMVAQRIPRDIRDTLSAEDIVQEAFIVAFQRIAEFEPRGERAFFGWLCQIAEHRLMDAAKVLRAAKRGGGWGRVVDDPQMDDLIPALEMLSVQSRTPSRSAADREAVRALEGALQALEPDYQQVLRLRYIEMHPVATCAERLGRSAGATQMLIRRALDALRVQLGDSARYFTRKS